MSATAVSRPPEPQRPAQTPQQGKAPGDKPVESDLFASLLGLVSDTHLSPEAAAPSPSESPAADTPPAPGQDQNPLAALLAWATPATPAAPSAATTSPVQAGTAGQSGLATDGALPGHRQAETGGVDISGMTPVVDEKLANVDPLATPANPASTAARPAFATPASRPAFASRTDASAQSGTPAMVWQRSGASGTDALQQQFATQSLHAHPLSSIHVRSTVAMDERFTLATSGAWQTNAPREGFEFTPLPGSGARAAATEAGPAVGTTLLADGAAAGDSTGGSSGDAPPGDPGGQAHDGTPAEREAEGPTVSHWGTQHLRHASLRVGESGTDAIDIQLSMKGQEVQVAFQSDNAEARASLREGASDALAELMQRSGIQLGQVSVGAQGQQHGGQAQHTPTVSRGEVAGREGSPSEVPKPIQPRADGSRPLDLFV